MNFYDNYFKFRHIITNSYPKFEVNIDHLFIISLIFLNNLFVQSHKRNSYDSSHFFITSSFGLRL